ncbi:MAG: hypothetical protein EPN84_01880 [Legionella sp.]|nr:MAG: hypothetical protein EPN84_01880 [Legionella sp.]
MNKIKLACIVSLLSSSFAYASPSCDGFELKIKNNLADDLLVTTIKLNGADLQPGGIQKIDGKTAQVFTVNSSAENTPMVGEFVFHTISIPSKTVKINFNLNNTALVCQHDDKPVDSDYAVESTRLPGSVSYTISNK